MWIALGLGLYIVVLSVSGSAIVFRREFTAWLVPRTVASTEGERLTGDALVAALGTAYPGDTVVEVREPRRPERPVSVMLERDGAPMERLFDPYAVRDLGETFPPLLRAVEWLVDLHDNLLAGQTGRLLERHRRDLLRRADRDGRVALVAGRAHVSRGLKVGRPQASRRFIWQLHSVLGILSFALLFVWAYHGDLLRVPRAFRGHDRLLRRRSQRSRAARRMGDARAGQAALRPLRRARRALPLGRARACCRRCCSRRASCSGGRASCGAGRRRCRRADESGARRQYGGGRKNVIMRPHSMTATRKTSEAAATIFALRGASSCGPSVRTPANSRQ